ncbi:hypothetical protein OG874_21570 [Nocardia sp. NBC_00565]|uniref:hypothetical protein n=1 Tax=Nocardia sp. NBC_00565 TaxID=2975993 RepID=UPI002E80C99E|nr:hypothetical protein [Nocardia sp. NBC_00565]WUC07515.1 hypothetical protein OG874_21570 [Nocardia sp. NBC_00565]
MRRTCPPPNSPPVRRDGHYTVIAATTVPADHRAPLLFPGRSGRKPLGFSERMLSHGITARCGRNTAMLNLAADLPARVLADLLGIHTGTAVRWTRQATRDWTDYIAQRRTDLDATE